MTTGFDITPSASASEHERTGVAAERFSLTSMVLRGRSAAITGGSRGFGLAVARAYAAAGANLALFARNSAELDAARHALVDEFPAARVVVHAGDVSRETDVAAFAEAAAEAFDHVDVVVCNAGIYGPKGPVETLNLAEWTRAIEINVTGVLLCARLFSAQLRASERGKVIVLSGGGATKPMPNLSAYAASKAAVVRFGETLAEEWRERGIDVNMVAPGALNTRLLDEILEAGPQAVGADFYAASLKQKQSGGSPLEKGASLCVFLASRASDGITGKLVSALWDPWETFAERREALDGTDVYTLRRIVPEDRNMAW